MIGRPQQAEEVALYAGAIDKRRAQYLDADALRVMRVFQDLLCFPFGESIRILRTARSFLCVGGIGAFPDGLDGTQIDQLTNPGLPASGKHATCPLHVCRSI
jgi:hypothetical protein